MLLTEIHGRTISFADPDYEPGAVDREAKARAGAAQALQKSNEIARKIASELGGKTRDVTLVGQIDRPTYTYVEGIKFTTRSGKDVNASIRYDAFSRNLALYLEPSPIPRKGDEGKSAEAVIKHVADDHGKKLYGMDFHSSSGTHVDWIDLGLNKENTIDIVKAIINVAKKY